MTTRGMGYKHYGMTNKEARELKRYCRSDGFEKLDLLRECARESNEAIADALVESITLGLSWEKLSGRRYVPYSKGDFYGYQRKCIYLFKTSMILRPDYKGWRQMQLEEFIN